MAKMPPIENPIVDAFFRGFALSVKDWRRDHLGASLIGEECNRRLWYGFRWVCNPKHPLRLLRLFDHGEMEEARIVRDLKAAGMKVLDRDPDGEPDKDGELPQFRFKECGGHFGGSIDGKVLGVPTALKTWHLLECKTSNASRFKTLVKDGVKKSNPKHYYQMQIYMHKMRLKRALYLCVNKNDDSVYVERVKYNKKEAEVTINRARLVIFSPEPMEPISKDPSWWQCGFCEHRPHCKLGRVECLERNCRTCLSSTPKEDGTWICELFGTTLDSDQARQGCEKHLFIPSILPGNWEVADVDEAARKIAYSAGKNGGTVIDYRRALEARP